MKCGLKGWALHGLVNVVSEIRLIKAVIEWIRMNSLARETTLKEILLSPLVIGLQSQEKQNIFFHLQQTPSQKELLGEVSEWRFTKGVSRKFYLKYPFLWSSCWWVPFYSHWSIKLSFEFHSRFTNGNRLSAIIWCRRAHP